MKTNFRLLCCGFLLALGPIAALAADGGFLEKLFPPLPKTDDNQVAGMIFVSSVTGNVEGRAIRINNLKKGDKLPGLGTEIRTDANATATLVFSNGTSVFLQEKTDFRVEKFDQEPFTPNNNLLIEPSNSTLVVYVKAGQLVISTPQLLSGTRIVFESPHAACYIMNNQSGGEKAFLEVTPGQTHFAMINGLARVKVRGQDGTLASIGSTVKTAQQAFVRYTLGANGGANGKPGAETIAVTSGGDMSAAAAAAPVGARDVSVKLPSGASVGVNEFSVGKVTGDVTRSTPAGTAQIAEGSSYTGRASILKTGPGASAVLFFANGTTLSLGEKVELKVDKFDQEPFTPNNNQDVEPSNSQSVFILRRGKIGVDTPQLLSGTTLAFVTAHGVISIANDQSGGQKASLEATEKNTHLEVVQGKALVRPRNPDGAFVSIGYSLISGQLAIVKPTAGADPKLNDKFVLEQLGTATVVTAGNFSVTNVTGLAECATKTGTVSLHAGDSIPAAGASVKTAEGARVTLLLANQTSLALEQNTELKVQKFVQEAFTAGSAPLGVEPSNSQTLVQIQTGQVTVNTPQLLSGTSLVLETPFSTITIPNGQPVSQQAAIDVNSKYAQCRVIMGAASVKPRGADGTFVATGTLLQAGQVAIIKPIAASAGSAVATGASLTTISAEPAPIAPAGTVPTTAKATAVVLRLYGSATYKLPDQDGQIALTLESAVPEGAVIETGDDAQVYLQPFPGAVTTIQPGSRILIEKLEVTTAGDVTMNRDFIVDLKKGTVLSMIDPAKHNINRYAIRTPKGLARAQGTSFTVNVGDDNMSVTATADTVSFTTPAGAVYSVAAGNVTITPPGGEPQPPIPLSQAVAANPAFSAVVQTAMTTVSNIVQNNIGNISSGSSANLMSQVVAVASAAVPAQATNFASQAITAVTATTSSTAGNASAAASAVTAAASIAAPTQVAQIAVAASQAAPASMAGAVATAAALTNPSQASNIAAAMLQSFVQSNPQASTQALNQASSSLTAAVNLGVTVAQQNSSNTAAGTTGGAAGSPSTPTSVTVQQTNASTTASTGGTTTGTTGSTTGTTGGTTTGSTTGSTTASTGGTTGGATTGSTNGSTTASTGGTTGGTTTGSTTGGTTNSSSSGPLQSTSVVISQINGGSTTVTPTGSTTTTPTGSTGGATSGTSIIVTQLTGGQVSQVNAALEAATNAQSTVSFSTTTSGNGPPTGSTSTVTATPVTPTTPQVNNVVSPANI